MTEIRVLIEEIRKSRQALVRIESFYDKTALVDPAEQTEEKAIVVAQTLAKYYTCLETVFLRISQFFENNLAPDRWHADLLEKMTLAIQGIRAAAIRDETYKALAELMKFRHFTRYYYDIDYDWDRLEYVMRKFTQVRPMLREDLDRFVEFLEELDAADPEEDE